MDFNLQPVLKSDLITLRPLRQNDFKLLFKVASDPLVWELHQQKDRYKEEVFVTFFDGAMKSKGAFAVIDNKTGLIIGSSRFRVIDESKSVIEIGWSFLGLNHWGGVYNREMKKLMINYALAYFERVVFYVHPKNFRSQRALEKLGALKGNNFGDSWVLAKDKGVTFSIDTPLV